jgi:hypothetical protein
MNNKERSDVPVISATARQALGEWTVAWPSDLLAGFTERERQHLIFLRWLYRQGHLTEWCRD